MNGIRSFTAKAAEVATSMITITLPRSYALRKQHPIKSRARQSFEVYPFCDQPPTREELA